MGQKLVKWKITFKIEKMGYWLKELWPMGVYLIVFTAYDRAVDSMMISKMLGLKEVAWYGLSYKIYNSLVQPAYFFVASVFPLLSSQIEGKKKLFLKSLGLILVVLLIGAPILSLMAPWMIQILGGMDYMPSVGVREASKNPEKAEEIFAQLTGLRLILANIGFVIGVILIFTFPGFTTIKWEALISLLMIFFTSIAGSFRWKISWSRRRGFFTFLL